MKEPRVIELKELPTLAGQDVGVSDWLLIDQARVNLFAEATGDHQWIHTDPERAARELPTKGTIAHGYLTLSLLPYLAGQILKVTGTTRGINYGLNKVRFTSMVPTGSRVRLRQKIVTVEPRAGGMQIMSEFAMEVEGQAKAACVAETISLLFP